jgi:hypothetical protein
MTLSAICADHEEMFRSERDRIGLHAASRQVYGSPDADEVAIPLYLADRIGSVVCHSSEIVAELQNSSVGAGAAIPTRWQCSFPG